MDVHIRRYRADRSDEIKAFKNVLWSFQNHLPLSEEPDLISDWDYFYERSIGCIGVLKEWLLKALRKALADGGVTLTLKHLKQSALSVSQCGNMLADATEGEEALEESMEALANLRSKMGLEARFTKAEGNEGRSSDRAEKAVPRRRRRPGERNPKRDPIGNTKTFEG